MKFPQYNMVHDLGETELHFEKGGVKTGKNPPGGIYDAPLWLRTEAILQMGDNSAQTNH